LLYNSGDNLPHDVNVLR